MTPSLAEATAAARRIRDDFADPESAAPFEADALLLAGFVLAGDTSLEAGSDSAWPVREALRVLADAANHLLREHNCDCLGWETIEAARQAAVELQARPLAGDTERLREALERLASPERFVPDDPARAHAHQFAIELHARRSFARAALAGGDA